MVLDGVIGAPEHVQWTHLSAGSRVPLRPHGWLFDRALGGGWIGAWGSHGIDALRWTFGEVADATRDVPHHDHERAPIATGSSARATPRTRSPRRSGPRPVSTVAIDTTFASPVNLAPRITVVGSDGVLECEADARLVVRLADGTRGEHTDTLPPGDRHLEPMRRFAVDVRDAVRAGVAPAGLPTFADGLACARRDGPPPRSLTTHLSGWSA